MDSSVSPGAFPLEGGLPASHTTNGLSPKDQKASVNEVKTQTVARDKLESVGASAYDSKARATLLRERAIELLQDISEPSSKAIALSEIAKHQAIVEEGEEFKQLFLQAKAAAAPDHDFVNDKSAVTLSIIGLDQAIAGDFIGAKVTISDVKRLVEDVYDPDNAPIILENIAKAEAVMGYIETAVDTALTIAGPYNRANTLNQMAKICVMAGNLRQAIRTLLFARKFALDPSDPVSGMYRLWDIALTQLEAADIKEAEITAEAICCPLLQARALSEIAKHHAQQSNEERATEVFARAKKIIEGIVDPGDVALTLNYIAGNQASSNHIEGANQTFDQAKKKAKAITKVNITALVLRDIALTQANAGQALGVQATCVDIKTTAKKMKFSFNDKSITLWKCVTAQAKVGCIEEAKVTASGITDSYYQVMALRSIALAQVAAGNRKEAQQIFIRAKTVADKIVAPGDKAAYFSVVAKDNALTLLAKAEVESGFMKEAEEAVEEITNQSKKIKELLKIL
ncbi:MAG: hypothetical protein SP4CHLAM5_09900 [Chlamydiia bacterium]|nr:hypothetical protein [Chlamydiia bacterium]MCH9618848.1 hypothetical protein [Chlamydiia bacterium]MCH9624551.1 hypothetical protein [Chlamydiia bacterium]